MTYIDATKAAQVIAGLPTDATDEMVASALAVNWDIEDEKALVHNIWHVMTGAFLRSTRPSTALLDETVPQAAKLAAVKAYVEIEGKCRPVAMTAALTAALPHLSAPCAVEVVKLNWVHVPNEPKGYSYRAKKPFGSSYHIHEQSDGMFNWGSVTGKLTEAKAAAQADFERRILSCVVTKPVDVAAVRRQAFEEAVLRLFDLANKARENGAKFHAKQHDEKYGARKKQRFYEEKKHFNRLAIGYTKSAHRIRALSAEPAQGDQWHDISSAPISNGSQPFLTHITGHGCSVCYKGAGGFIYSSSSGRRIYAATHWMPLPAAPTTEAGK